MAPTPTDAISTLLSEAVRLLQESGRHFKSRQVAEARRLLEQAITQLEESHAKGKNQNTAAAVDTTPTEQAGKTQRHDRS